MQALKVLLIGCFVLSVGCTQLKQRRWFENSKHYGFNSTVRSFEVPSDLDRSFKNCKDTLTELEYTIQKSDKLEDRALIVASKNNYEFTLEIIEYENGSKVDIQGNSAGLERFTSEIEMMINTLPAGYKSNFDVD